MVKGKAGMKLVKTRLAAMMFLEYFVWGAWYVTVGTWLEQTQHFTGVEIGLVVGSTAVGAIVSPFLVGWLADRFFATQHVLAALHAAGAVLLYLASERTAFAPLYALIVAYACCYMPTMALTNSLAFRHIRDPRREFGPIRMLGSAGWIVVGLIVGGLKLEATAIPLRLAAASSLVLAIYALTLPDTPPIKQAGSFNVSHLLPAGALRLLREPSFAVFALTSCLICIPLQLYYAFTNLYLNETGLRNAAGKMTGAQLSEMLFMLLIPWFFRKLGVKYMLFAGMAAWALRYVLFAFGNAGGALWMLYAGILLHGLCFTFVFVTGQLYVNRKAPTEVSAAAQGMLTLITYGVGMMLGSWLSGQLVDHFATVALDGSVTHAWRPIWLIAAGLSAAILLLFLFTFKEQESSAPPAAAE